MDGGCRISRDIASIALGMLWGGGRNHYYRCQHCVDQEGKDNGSPDQLCIHEVGFHCDLLYGNWTRAHRALSKTRNKNSPRRDLTGAAFCVIHRQQPPRRPAWCRGQPRPTLRSLPGAFLWGRTTLINYIAKRQFVKHAAGRSAFQFYGELKDNRGQTNGQGGDNGSPDQPGISW